MLWNLNIELMQIYLSERQNIEPVFKTEISTTFLMDNSKLFCNKDLQYKQIQFTNQAFNSETINI